MYVFSQSDVQIGLLLSCFSVSSTPPLNLCVLQKLAPLVSAVEEQCLNDFDCPILNLTNDLYLLPVSYVIKPISIAHCCTQSCIFVDNVSFSRVEREQITSSKLVFLHDLCNTKFCYNIFCTSNNF